ncbi:hypothetical protein KGF57_002553 [Candida theae]|uniref:RRM domain-containing protein n=1 Tax=Candida theae TaxID=1198502 RepID=A0AAD5FYF7_9ASCO|nr:uncharacterized protein KGF57_002553 [Candida theae]KAI5958198.1 hypothetical protein KGF57_002553 [Candida theae]
MYQQVFYNNHINRNGGDTTTTPLKIAHYSNINGGGVPPSPLTPLDLRYSQSMLPSNLFVSTPYFTPPPSAQYFPPISHHSSLRNSDASLTNSHASYSKSHSRHNQRRNSAGYHKQHQQQNYADQRSIDNVAAQDPTFQSHNSRTVPFLHPNLENMNISRTVILRNLKSETTLHEVLDHIDFGPIEYIKMLPETSSNGHGSGGEEGEKEEETAFKSCSISFINSNISAMFYLKYAKNSSNLNKLRQVLKSEKLKITINDVKKQRNGSGLPRQDYIKLKNLNYIIDHNATRCLEISFSVNDALSDETTAEDRLNHLRHYISSQCEKFGDFESFEIDLEKEPTSLENEEGEEESGTENTLSGSVIVHFTSIDSAINTYESYQRKIQNDLEKQNVDNTETAIIKKKRGSSNDLYDVSTKYGISFISATFHRDRCDKTLVQYRDDAELGMSANITTPNGEAAMKLTMEDGTCGLIEEEAPLDNSSEVCSIIGSPGQHSPNKVNILDPVSPNSSDIENASPILHDTYAPSQGDHTDDSEAHAPSLIGSNGVYSMISSDARQMNATPQFVHIPMAAGPPFAFHSNSSFVSSYNPDPINTGNRAIHLGNLHPHTTIEEIANNLRAGGLVESLNHFPERRMCFVTFVDADIALKFFMNHQVLHQLVIHGSDVSVGWAKRHSGPVSREIALAVTAGASRNVYLGLRKSHGENSGSNLTLPSEDELRSDFSRIGGLEQINFYHNKQCAFLNFLNIADAIKAVRAFECEEPNAVIHLTKSLRGDQVAANVMFQKYKCFKVSFGKDRCGNRPKFSFRKNFDKSLGSTYQQYQDQLHACVGKSKANSNKDNGRASRNGIDEHLNGREPSSNGNVINDEAASVFGIIKDEENQSEPAIEEGQVGASHDRNGLSKSDREVGSSVEQDSTKEAYAGKQDDDDKGGDQTNGDSKQTALVLTAVPGAEVEEYEDEEDDDDDDDDDDDVSIIIGSDHTVSTNASGKNDSFNDTFAYRSQKSRARRQNFNNQPYYYEQPHLNGRTSRNSSTHSINNGSVFPPYAQFASPQFGHQPTRMSRTSSTSSFRSQGYQPSPQLRNGCFQHQPPHSSGAYQQQMYMVPPSPQFMGSYTPHIRFVPVVSGPQVVATPMVNHPVENGSGGTSGSQVMAQYLAHAQPMGVGYNGSGYVEPHGSHHYNGRRYRDGSKKGRGETS